jgi:hypothetical protein
MSADLQARVAELEGYARRIIPARDGQDGWVNYIQACLLEERNFSHDVVARALAMMRDDILDACKATIDQALATRVRGTFQPGSNYARGDIVALDGGSFIARKDHPGKCPGEGWQLVARQGQRGIAGPEGKRGPPGQTITGWIVDRGAYRITPRMSDGTLGAPLELRELFAPSEENNATA